MSPQVHPLKNVATELERMRAEAVAEGRPMLALTLQLARDEAEEELLRQVHAKRRAARSSNVIRFPGKRRSRRRPSRAAAAQAARPLALLLTFPVRARA